MESVAARPLYGRAPGTLRHCLFTCAMDSRRLVVWISTGILGFQGATLAFDLLNCTALSWLYVRSNGLAAIERRIDEPAGRSGVADPDAPQKSSGASTPETLLRCFAPALKGGLMTPSIRG